jgi:hypothetical protein
MEANRPEVKEVKRKEPECTAIRSYKNKPLKDYHIIAEKYRVLNGFKNVVIGVITGAVMLVNGWIEVDSKAGQLLVALGMVILVTLLMHCTDEILNEQVD